MKITLSADVPMALPSHEGVWACGDDCAAIPDASGHRTTRESARSQVGRNIAAAIRVRIRFAGFDTRCWANSQAIGRQRAVVSILGLQFSGFFAWLLWRSAYLSKLPSVMKKLRVVLEWTLNLCFPRDTVQLLTVQSVRSGRLDQLLESAREADFTDVAETDPHPRLLSASRK